MFKDVAAVLFDLDGTLVDSAPDLGAAADQMRTDRGLPSYPFDHYRSMAGAGARGMLQQAFGMTPEHPDFPAMREEFFGNYERRLTALTSVFDGVDLLLRTLQDHNIPWGIVTNKSSRFTEPLVGAIAMFASASVVISGDTTPHSKPHPAPLLEAARRLAVAPGRCVYVGDDERDIVAGHAAGMATVSATYGYLGARSDVTAWNAHASINSPTELLQWIALT